MSKINVIILAGGVSSRFWPLEQKNIYKFFGKVPFDHHLKRIGKLHPNKIVIVTNEGIRISYPNTETVVQRGLGMAGGVLTALENLNPEDELLIIGANDYYDETIFDNFIKIRDDLKEKKYSAIAAYKTDSYFPGGYLKLKGDVIQGIIEKPPQDQTPSDYVNIVFHYFPKAEIISNSLYHSKTQKDDLYEVALDNLIKKGQTFKLIKYLGKWKSIKYPWQVLDVMEFFLEQIQGQKISKDTQISDKATVKGNVIIEKGVRIFEGAVVNGPVYIGENTIIANSALVRHSMVGENCVIGYSSEVTRSYLKNDVWLHKNYVGDSVFESNISLGSGTVTGNLRLDEQNIIEKIKENDIDTKRNKLGAIIGSNVRIGINVSIMPGIKIGSGSFIGPAALINTDIPDNSYVKATNKFVIAKNRSSAKFDTRVEFKNKI